MERFSPHPARKKADSSPHAGESKRGLALIPLWAIQRPVASLTVIITAFVLGIVGLRDLPVDLFPRISPPYIGVFVEYEGASPSILETTVTKPIEAALSSVEGVEGMYSRIRTGRSFTRLRLGFNTELDAALRMASTRIDRIRSILPEGADSPRIFKFDPMAIPMMDLVITIDGTDSTSNQHGMYRFVDQVLEKELKRVPGVASVQIQGGAKEAFHVVFDPSKVIAEKLSFQTIVSQLQTANKEKSLGQFTYGGQAIPAQIGSQLQSIRDLENFPFYRSDGSYSALRTLARVTTENPKPSVMTRFLEHTKRESLQAIRISVQRSYDSSSAAVSQSVRERIDDLFARGAVPSFYDIYIVRDDGETISTVLDSFLSSALWGALFALIVVSFFMGTLRESFIIGLSIPVSIALSFWAMDWFGLSLNIASVGGLVLGVGILVDQSIVVLENISKKYTNPNSSFQAAVHGSGEVAGAVTTGALTNIVAVIPFLWVGGLAQILFSELILSLCFSVLASLFVSLTLVPLLAHLLFSIRFHSPFRNFYSMQFFKRIVNYSILFYTQSLTKVWRRKWFLFVAVCGLCVVSVIMAMNQGANLVPPLGQNRIEVSIRLPVGSPLESTDRFVQEIEKLLAEDVSFDSAMLVVGGQKFSDAVYSHTAFLFITLDQAFLPDGGVQKWTRDFRLQLEEYAKPYRASVRVRSSENIVSGLTKSGQEISVWVQGENSAQIRATVSALKERFKKVDFVSGWEANFAKTLPEARLLFLPHDAQLYNVLQNEAIMTAQFVQEGITAGYVGDDKLPLLLHFDHERYAGINDLAWVPMLSVDGVGYYLKDVMDIQIGEEALAIERINEQRTLEMSAAIKERQDVTITETVAAFTSILKDFSPPKGITIALRGEQDDIAAMSSDMLLSLLLGIFFVIAVMSIQYESVVRSLIIVTTIPLVGVGVGIGFWLFNLPLSGPMALGLVVLAGIVVNNGILLVEACSKRQEQGMSLIYSVVRGSASRLRPILMTSLTTMMGALPLSLGLQDGGAFLQPLGATIIFGLFSSLFLSLYVTPIFYGTVIKYTDKFRVFLRKGSQD